MIDSSLEMSSAILLRNSRMVVVFTAGLRQQDFSCGYNRFAVTLVYTIWTTHVYSKVVPGVVQEDLGNKLPVVGLKLGRRGNQHVKRIGRSTGAPPPSTRMAERASPCERQAA